MIPCAGIILFNNTNGKQCTIKNNDIDSIDIQILNDDNQYIDFNGIHWNMTMEITIFRKVEITKTTSFNDIVNIKKHLGNTLAESDIYNDDLQFLLYQNGIYL